MFSVVCGGIAVFATGVTGVVIGGVIGTVIGSPIIGTITALIAVCALLYLSIVGGYFTMLGITDHVVDADEASLLLKAQVYSTFMYAFWMTMAITRFLQVGHDPVSLDIVRLLVAGIGFGVFGVAAFMAVYVFETDDQSSYESYKEHQQWYEKLSAAEARVKAGIERWTGLTIDRTLITEDRIIPEDLRATPTTDARTSETTSTTDKTAVTETN